MDDTEELDDLASRAAGESVTAEALRETVGSDPLFHLLGPDEQPEFLLRGNILDVVDRNAPETDDRRRSRKVADRGTDLLTLVTDERLLVLVPREAEAERVTVPLSAVTHVDTESAPGVSRRLRVRTDDTAYYVDASGSDGDDAAAVAAFVADRQHRDGGGADADGVLDTIERLADLRDRGALTDEEFERKKTELLDRL